MERISELISRLEEIKAKHGDLLLGGGYMTDSSGPNTVIVLDEGDCCADVIGEGFKPHSVFFET